MKKFIMYGAGNIGRGFIGPTFSNAGYLVGFIDVNKEIISKLNSDKQYPMEIVSNDGVESSVIKNVYGIDGSDLEQVATEIASCDVMATAIGVNVLKFIAKPIALGLKKRFEQTSEPLNIIICENLIGADEYLKGLVKEQIPEYAEQIEKQVGFVEASIGRMVPALSEEKRKQNALAIAVEPYNILPVDKNAFKGEIPKVENLYPYAPFNLFIQRKLFMHNLSHALTAYLGYLKNYQYIYQAIADYDIRYCAYKALVQSAQAIADENNVEIKVLLSHADNLIYRFKNVNLKDTVARVGKDTVRKLGSNDRLIGAINLCDAHGLDCQYICLGVAAAMYFCPDDDENSKILNEYCKNNGVIKTLEKFSGYNGKNKEFISQLYSQLQNGSSISQIIEFCDQSVGKSIRV